MSTVSNLYAEKIFSEHPKSMWPLDDDLTYISLLPESDRDMTEWSLNPSTATVEFASVSGEPFHYSPVFRITTPPPTTTAVRTLTLTSDKIINFQDLDKNLKTFNIGSYFYSESKYLAGMEIGYMYNDTTNGSEVIKTKEFQTSIYDRWMFISETFEIPNEVAEFKIVFRITYLRGSTQLSDYTFLINGLSIGQWSEEFNSTSLGIETLDIPSDINITTSKGVEAKAYGLESNSAYYLSDGKTLYARNGGIPMAYGSSNITKLYPNPNGPSMIVPGLGFLNNVGRYNSYTCEMWLRINSDATEDKKIFGPISSPDGIYVSGPFIKINVGGYRGSHYVGEWSRPMLVDFRVSKNVASLLINGQQVISINAPTDSLSLPNEYTMNKSNDWLGFWSYEDVSPLEVDCVAIYPYSVPEAVAKRRFVYGQGVDLPENINTAYSGSSVMIDYDFSEYTNNYSYPDLGKWSQGTKENLVIEKNILSTAKYEHPEIYLNNKDVATWYSDCSAMQTEDSMFFTMKKTNTEINEGYLVFNNLGFLSDPIKCFYGVFKSRRSVSEPEILFKLQSDISDNYLIIDLFEDKIRYRLHSDNTSETFYTAVGHTPGEKFSVGIDIDSMVEYYGGNLAKFFTNKESIKLYVAGSKTLDSTYHGNIYRVGFASAKNFNEISHLFNERGFPLDYENVFSLYLATGVVDVDAGSEYFGNSKHFWDYFLDGGSPTSYSTYYLDEHIASYTLLAKEYFGSYVIDIATKGYWKDYVPLSYFAEKVLDARGDEYYDVDFIQFNIDYPAPSLFARELDADGSWTYQELNDEYSSPIQRTYESLDNHLFTGFNDYQDLKNNSKYSFKYDTSNSYVRSYVTFQYNDTGLNAPDGYFIHNKSANKNGVVYPNTDWMNTKYEVVNNMIVYTPKSVDPRELSVVVELEVIVNGSLNGTVNIKKMQMASQSFSESEPKIIGTRYGTNLYPYRKSGVYFNYKSTNPFSIYKGNSPYLYLTRYSGIELRDSYDPRVNRGISIPINPEKSNNYKVMAMQSAIRYDNDFFPYAPTQIFEIESEKTYIKFFMVATQSDGKRAKIYAVNSKTGKIDDTVVFYLNGKVVSNPVITIRDWAFLGISFSNLIDFSDSVGSIRLTGPMLFNLISHYQSTNLQEVQNVSTRPWFLVRGVGASELDWYFWDSGATNWKGVLVLSAVNFYGANPSDIYRSYTGTDKIVVDSGKTLGVGGYKYSIYSDILWQQQVSDAV